MKIVGIVLAVVFAAVAACVVWVLVHDSRVDPARGPAPPAVDEEAGPGAARPGRL